MSRRIAPALALALLALGLAGCGLKPAPIPPSDGELTSDRPGLLSGPEGQFTVYRR